MVSTAQAESAIADPAVGLLRRREFVTLKRLTGTRLLMLAVIFPLPWLLGSSPVENAC